MELIPLGTSSASIVRDRGLSAYVLRDKGSVFLFDCGDGTQFRLLKANIRRSRIKAIFISHLHGDHYLGIFGLLTSMFLEGRKAPLTIVAPRGLADIVDAHPGISSSDLSFPVQYVNLDEDLELEEVYREPGLQVSTRPLEHGKFCVGYRAEKKPEPNQIDGKLATALGVTDPEQFQKLAQGLPVDTSSGYTVSPDQVRYQTGTVFAYVTDTRPCQGGLDLANNADLLVHEATFSKSDAKHARDTRHSTTDDAALLAKNAGAKKLLLTHISSRYRDTVFLENEARAVFPNSEIAQEYRTYPIVPERIELQISPFA
ncbi:MAG: ribonuclease Z [Bacteroidetes bacterium]|nr:ribonuclease Z [Bacteroidota bacterium]MCY4205891.1 ribonuclease Z [Bacteroidota bacterium]